MSLSEARPGLAAILVALADPTRRAVYEVILEDPGITTGELALTAASVSRWAVIKHLKVLRSAGLIQTMATGRSKRHYPERAALDPLREWIAAI